MNLSPARLACFFTIFILVVIQNVGICCVGARPLAMGGAFTGLADDANATYWNPAGLSRLPSTEIATMHTITNRGSINYQEYAAIALPVKSGFAFGASWIRTNQAILDVVSKEDWYWVSLSHTVGDKAAVGINIRSIQDESTDIESDLAFDVGALYDLNEKVRIGFLLQNANKPHITFGGKQISFWSRNFRPGLSIRQGKSSVVSMELYDASNNGDMRSLRLGYEKNLSGNFAVRGGYYGLGCSENDAFTIGVGVTSGKSGKNETSAASLDLAMMFGDLDALFGSVNFKF